MDKLKEAFINANDKFPLVITLTVLFLVLDVIFLKDVVVRVTFNPSMREMYQLPDAAAVNERVQRQIGGIKLPPLPPPPPPPTMPLEVRDAREKNPFNPPGQRDRIIEFVEGTGEEENTDRPTIVEGINLIGTVFTYNPMYRTALIDYEGIAFVIRQGATIRSTQKKVIEISKSYIKVKEPYHTAVPVYLPTEQNIEMLYDKLKKDHFRENSNWEYCPQSGCVSDEEDRLNVGDESSDESEETFDDEEFDLGAIEDAEAAANGEGEEEASTDQTFDENATDEESEPAADEEVADDEDWGDDF